MPGEQLLLINPRRRKRRKNPRGKRRARRAAGGFRIRRRRVKNPRSHKRRRHRNPRRHHARRRHRNPVSLSGIKGVLLPAAMGAAGGLALDVAWNYLSPYVPASISASPYMVAAAKIAAAFGIGLVARKFLGRDKGNAVMAGAVTIQVYSLAAFALAGTVPGLSGLGAYLPGSRMAGLGATSPATYLNGMGRVGRMGAYLKPMSGLSGLGGLGLGGMPGSMDTDMMS